MSEIKTKQDEATTKAVEKLWREAQRPDLTHFEDEDTVSFTRAEVRLIWGRIRNDARRMIQGA